MTVDPNAKKHMLKRSKTHPFDASSQVQLWSSRLRLHTGWNVLSWVQHVNNKIVAPTCYIWGLLGPCLMAL